ncbi:MAG TPA: molybdopterin-dependent oxidoreductase [Clostridia bacterium]|nr:molybdopterin-dependent oxidoreductase [Clostridia bacterium]
MTYRSVGQPTPFIDGWDKVTGQVKYITDLTFPGMLYGKVLRSPLPHARILNIDTSAAKKVPGVKAVITAKDTPGIRFGTTHDDWYILAPDKVRFVGEEIAAVAAIDEETALEALDLIKCDFEELPAVFDPEEAMEPGAPKINEADRNIAHHFHVERGDVNRAFGESAVVYENRFETSQVYQAYLEPNAAIAEYDPNHGSFTLWLPIQIPSKCRITYSKALGIPMSHLRVIQAPMGGGFGGKMENNLHLIAAVLAKATGKPVKMVYSREEDFIATNPRVPMKIDIKIGVASDGRILAKEVRIIASNGGRTCYGVPILGTACFRIDTLYRFENVKADGYLVYTNTVPTGCFRGFGNAQMTFALESALDAVAEELRMDPAELRLRNAPEAPYVSVHGWEVNSCGLKECISKVVEASGWREKRAEKRTGYGIGIACCDHVSGYRAFIPWFDGSAALVRITEDAKVKVYSGEVDLGQGLKTVLAQIASEVLSVPLHDVTIEPVDSETTPFNLGAFASRSTMLGGKAVKMAAEDARGKIIAFASEILQRPKDSLDLENGFVVDRSDASFRMPLQELTRKYLCSHGGASIIGEGCFDTETVIPDPVTKYGNPSKAYPFAAQVAEVEVDMDTGQVKVLRVYAAHDLGKCINPLGATGQIEGGVAMGVGWALTENMIVQDGRIINPNFLDYRVPGIKDVPKVESFLVETNEPFGPFGAKGLGEPALNPTVPAILNAIYHATGVRITRLPVDPEEILNGSMKA